VATLKKIFFGGTGIWTQGFPLAKQAPHHLVWLLLVKSGDLIDGVAQVVQGLSSKHETLNSNPVPPKIKKQKQNTTRRPMIPPREIFLEVPKYKKLNHFVWRIGQSLESSLILTCSLWTFFPTSYYLAGLYIICEWRVGVGELPFFSYHVALLLLSVSAEINENKYFGSY
jgi:hypothetical protein